MLSLVPDGVLHRAMPAGAIPPTLTWLNPNPCIQVAQERLNQRKAAARQHIMDAATASAKSGAFSKLSGKTPGRAPAKAAVGSDTTPQTLKFPDGTLPGGTVKGVLLPGGGPEASATGRAERLQLSHGVGPALHVQLSVSRMFPSLQAVHLGRGKHTDLAPQSCRGE